VLRTSRKDSVNALLPSAGLEVNRSPASASSLTFFLFDYLYGEKMKKRVSGKELALGG